MDQTLVNFDEKDDESVAVRGRKRPSASSSFRGPLKSTSGMDDDYGEAGQHRRERKGFLICRHCGRLQPENGESIPPSCPARNKESEANLADCTCTQSEALRILLPPFLVHRRRRAGCPFIYSGPSARVWYGSSPVHFYTRSL